MRLWRWRLLEQVKFFLQISQRKGFFTAPLEGDAGELGDMEGERAVSEDEDAASPTGDLCEVAGAGLVEAGARATRS